MKEVQGRVTTSVPLFTYQWLPDSQPKAVVYLIHGMMEHAQRYRHFAHFLSQNGIAVVAFDQRGAGQTAQHTGLGHLDLGWDSLLSDIHAVYQHHHFPTCPHFILGHSMGSFLAQDYCIRHCITPCGLILSGSAYLSPALTQLGKWLAAALKWLSPSPTPSSLLSRLSFLGYNRRVDNPKTPFDWLSRDLEQVAAYCADPFCGQGCSPSFYHALYTGLNRLYKVRYLKQLPNTTPLLILGGQEDPLSDYGRLLQTLVNAYHGYPVTHILYDGARHEILNELNQETVYHDILSWINSKLY